MNWFTVLFTQPLANGLIIFYKLFGGNLGLAVIFFSLFLRFALTPLTRPYMENMKRMKEHAPELEKLKKKYKNDKQKLMQAQADFYKNKGINPGNGCLPYLIQIIILIALFRVFINVLTASDIVLKFNELLYGPLKLTAGTVISTKFLYLDLAKPDAFKLAVLPFSLPGPFLIASAVVQFLSAKLQMPQIEADKNVSKQTKGKEDDFAVAMQSSMIYTFPLMTLLIGLSFPSGLALYWLIFSGYQLAESKWASGSWKWRKRVREVRVEE